MYWRGANWAQTSSHSSVPESTSPADGGSCLCQGWSGGCYLHLHVHLLHHHLLVDQDLEMRCAFELEGENLYSIKWFQVGLIIIVIMIMTINMMMIIIMIMTTIMMMTIIMMMIIIMIMMMTIIMMTLRLTNHY